MSAREIENRVREGNTGEYSHAIICCDRYDYSDYVVYVRRSEDIHAIISEISSKPLTSIIEVYNYDMDLGFQFLEERAYHVDVDNIEIAAETELDLEDDRFLSDTEGLFREMLGLYEGDCVKYERRERVFANDYRLQLLTLTATLSDFLNTGGMELSDFCGMDISLIKSKKTKAFDSENISFLPLTIKLCNMLDKLDSFLRTDNTLSDESNPTRRPRSIKSVNGCSLKKI